MRDKKRLVEPAATDLRSPAEYSIPTDFETPNSAENGTEDDPQRRAFARPRRSGARAEGRRGTFDVRR